MQDGITRATQHLVRQGFTLIPCGAAVCTRIVARAYLDNPELPWAVLFDPESMQWTPAMADDDPLKEIFANASVRSATPKSPHVVCHTQGAYALLPMVVADVRDARMNIEAAVALGKSPPTDRLEAFSDDAIEREAKRRKKARKEGDDQPSGENEAQ